MKCGIEIHQRLLGSKLFCRCPASAPESAANTIIERRLHAVRSEMGELDSAVRLESVRERAFEYASANLSSCLVEADEEPPHSVNEGALHAALCICGLLQSRAVDELHVMRKNVIDGSNTSGFQRTALIGLGGNVVTPFGKLEIQSICLEEESAGIIEGNEEKAKYSLDRLGIPLIEIATAPTIKSGKEAQEAALAIGTLLRSTGAVQRGIGTIRQDLNVSTENGARVEIKGVQELSMIAKTVELEVERQEKLLSILTEAKKRLAGRQIEEKFFDLSAIFAETRAQMISKAMKNGAKVFGMLLPAYAGLLGKEVNPNRRLGSELADYARSTGVKGIIHSDEQMEKYGISDDEISEVRVALSMKPDDAFALVVADEGKARLALSEVARRAGIFSVVEETRKANVDGTSSYMRPLPGRARMYPETDVPHTLITPDMLAAAKKSISSMEKAVEEKEESLSSLPEELRAQLAGAKNLLPPSASAKPGITPEISAFTSAMAAGIDAKLAASAITNTLSSLKREGISTQNLTEARFLSALSACKNGTIAKAALQEILREMCNDAKATPQTAAKKLSLEKISGKLLSSLIKEEKLDLAGLMAKYRLRVDAAEAKALLEKKK